MGQGREVCRDQRLPSITSRSADAPDDRCGSKPGLPPWGPHVRFHRLQTCPRGQSVGQAAQFCLAERCTEFRLAIIRADRCSDSVIRWPWMPTKTREPGRLGQVGPVGNTWLHEPPRGIMHVRYGGISGSDRRVVRTLVWSGRALQVDFAELAVSGLASMYPAFDWSICCSGPAWISARVRSR